MSLKVTIDGAGSFEIGKRMRRRKLFIRQIFR